MYISVSDDETTNPVIRMRHDRWQAEGGPLPA